MVTLISCAKDGCECGAAYEADGQLWCFWHGPYGLIAKEVEDVRDWFGYFSRLASIVVIVGFVILLGYRVHQVDQKVEECIMGEIRCET